MAIEKLNLLGVRNVGFNPKFKGEEQEVSTAETIPDETEENTEEVKTSNTSFAKSSSNSGIYAVLGALATIGVAGIAIAKHKEYKNEIKKALEKAEEAVKKAEELEKQNKELKDETEQKVKEAIEETKKKIKPKTKYVTIYAPSPAPAPTTPPVPAPAPSSASAPAAAPSKPSKVRSFFSSIRAKIKGMFKKPTASATSASSAPSAAPAPTTSPVPAPAPSSASAPADAPSKPSKVRSFFSSVRAKAKNLIGAKYSAEKLEQLCTDDVIKVIITRLHYSKLALKRKKDSLKYAEKSIKTLTKQLKKKGITPFSTEPPYAETQLEYLKLFKKGGKNIMGQTANDLKAKLINAGVTPCDTKNIDNQILKFEQICAKIKISEYYGKIFSLEEQIDLDNKSLKSILGDEYSEKLVKKLDEFVNHNKS